jgi:hypothetical protein
MTFENAAERLRAAVEAGDYKRAIRLLDEFQVAVEAAIEGRPPGSPQIVDNARDQVAGIRQLALCHRAHIAAELEILQRAGPYLNPHERRGGLHFEG